MDRDQLLNDGETAFRVAFDGRQAQLWTALPCSITSVDLTAMTVECQPTIQGVISLPDDLSTSPPHYVNLPVLVDVPIVFPSGGGFTLTFPLAIGDEVLVVIASRCIDQWWYQGGTQPPAEMRMHDLSDGFAIPGPKSQPNVITGISSTNAQLRNASGTLHLELTAGGKVNIVTTAGVGITGDVNVTGKITATGDISSSTGDVKAGLISLTNHTHLVTTAPGTTGPALP